MKLPRITGAQLGTVKSRMHYARKSPEKINGGPRIMENPS